MLFWHTGIGASRSISGSPMFGCRWVWWVEVPMLWCCESDSHCCSETHGLPQRCEGLPLHHLSLQGQHPSRHEDAHPHALWEAFHRPTGLFLIFLIIKPTRCTNVSNLFWNETLHVSDSSCIHCQEFFTLHTAVVYVIQVCWRLWAGSGWNILILLAAVSKPVWRIPLLYVQWKTDEGQRNCPKHVEFHSKTNLRN